MELSEMKQNGQLSETYMPPYVAEHVSWHLKRENIRHEISWDLSDADKASLMDAAAHFEAIGEGVPADYMVRFMSPFDAGDMLSFAVRITSSGDPEYEASWKQECKKAAETHDLTYGDSMDGVIPVRAH